MTSALYIVAGLVLALVVVNLVAGRLPRKGPRPGKSIGVAGRELHYIERPGDGIPVVLIHGMPGTALDFTHVLDELPGTRCLAFDRPGYGWSTGGPVPFREQVEAVHAALGELGVARAVFVGHSYGGTFCLSMAIDHPESVAALVLVAPAAGGSRVSEATERQSRLIRRLQRPGVRQVADLLFLRAARRIAAQAGASRTYPPGERHDAARRRAVAVLARHESIGALMSDRLEFNAVARGMRDSIDSIAAPAIIIHGDNDRTVPLRNGRRLHEALDESELHEVEGGHTLLDTHPDSVAAAVRRFLGEAGSGARGEGETG
ncbi:MAG: alpha/beta hydrolase [Actinobacteria bacterium]|nr:alpha/beta hydrolase [Actinomycetota bacterium]